VISIGEISANTVMAGSLKFPTLAGAAELIDSSGETGQFSAILNILQESQCDVLQGNRRNILQESQCDMLQENICGILQENRHNILQEDRCNIPQESQCDVLQESRCDMLKESNVPLESECEMPRENRVGTETECEDAAGKPKAEKPKDDVKNPGIYQFHCNLYVMPEDTPEDEKKIDAGLQRARQVAFPEIQTKTKVWPKTADKITVALPDSVSSEIGSSPKADNPEALQQSAARGGEEIVQGNANSSAKEKGEIQSFSDMVVSARTADRPEKNSRAEMEIENTVSKEAKPGTGTESKKISIEPPEKESAKVQIKTQKESEFAGRIHESEANRYSAEEKKSKPEVQFAEGGGMKPGTDVFVEKKAVARPETEKDAKAQQSAAAQIAKTAGESIRRGVREFRLKLKPDGLGEVTVNLSFKNNKIEMRVRSETEKTKELIKAQIGILKNDLEQNGYSIDSLTVEARTSPEIGGGNYSGGHGHGNYSGNGDHGAMDRGEQYRGEWNTADVKTTVKTPQVYLKNGAINYKA
jgi:flagellar hook-length control protein FliK